ncbi:hypothetical protein [Thermus scotoductus]|uniref:hypothetical protein n=1 Tax=Thermus scotoductus TaxID=37636 RepID=UPI000F80E237
MAQKPQWVEVAGVPYGTPATSTHCGFCAMQCAMQLHPDGTVKPLPHPINKGRLCVLGLTSGALLGHTHPLRTPLVRQKGQL